MLITGPCMHDVLSKLITHEHDRYQVFQSLMYAIVTQFYSSCIHRLSTTASAVLMECCRGKGTQHSDHKT